MTHTVSDPKLRNSTTSAFWFTLILVVLLISALNFVHNYSTHLNEAAHHEAAVAPHAPAQEHEATPPSAAPAEKAATNESAAKTTSHSDHPSTSGESH